MCDWLLLFIFFVATSEAHFASLAVQQSRRRTSLEWPLRHNSCKRKSTQRLQSTYNINSCRYSYAMRMEVRRLLCRTTSNEICLALGCCSVRREESSPPRFFTACFVNDLLLPTSPGNLLLRRATYVLSQVWLSIPEDKIEAIKEVVGMLHNASLL